MGRQLQQIQNKIMISKKTLIGCIKTMWLCVHVKYIQAAKQCVVLVMQVDSVNQWSLLIKNVYYKNI